MQSQNGSIDLSRRRFISQVLPACSLVCLGCSSSLLGFSPSLGKMFQKDKHKFDKEAPMKFTNKQMVVYMLGRDHIPFLKLLSKEIGEDRVKEILKKQTEERSIRIGKMMAKQFGSNDFDTLKKIFSPDSPNFKDSLTMSITESTDRVHELKVTECIFASVYLQQKAGELGWASVCHGDYAMATAFNPKIRMVRNKTLMQGHDCCNHRYLLEA
jgi:hypothetical protein